MFSVSVLTRRLVFTILNIIRFYVVFWENVGADGSSLSFRTFFNIYVSQLVVYKILTVTTFKLQLSILTPVLVLAKTKFLFTFYINFMGLLLNILTFSKSNLCYIDILLNN